MFFSIIVKRTSEENHGQASKINVHGAFPRVPRIHSSNNSLQHKEHGYHIKIEDLNAEQLQDGDRFPFLFANSRKTYYKVGKENSIAAFIFYLIIPVCISSKLTNEEEVSVFQR